MARAYSAQSAETRGRRSAARPALAVTSRAHVAPVRLPEPAHRGLGGARLLGLGALAAHIDHGHLVLGGGSAAPDEAAHATILHRHVARGADKVGLPEAPATHLGVVVGV